jgi:hypothetical protein
MTGPPPRHNLAMTTRRIVIAAGLGFVFTQPAHA